MFTRLDKHTPKVSFVLLKLHPKHNLNLAFSFWFYLILLFHIFWQSQFMNKRLQPDCYQQNISVLYSVTSMLPHGTATLCVRAVLYKLFRGLKLKEQHVLWGCWLLVHQKIQPQDSWALELTQQLRARGGRCWLIWGFFHNRSAPLN